MLEELWSRNEHVHGDLDILQNVTFWTPKHVFPEEKCEQCSPFALKQLVRNLPGEHTELTNKCLPRIPNLTSNKHFDILSLHQNQDAPPNTVSR